MALEPQSSPNLTTTASLQVGVAKIAGLSFPPDPSLGLQYRSGRWRVFSVSCPPQLCAAGALLQAVDRERSGAPFPHLSPIPMVEFLFQALQPQNRVLTSLFNIIHRVKVLCPRGKLRGSWATALAQSPACTGEISFWGQATVSALIPTAQQWCRRLT